MSPYGRVIVNLPLSTVYGNAETLTIYMVQFADAV